MKTSSAAVCSGQYFVTETYRSAHQMAHVNVSDSNDMLFWGAMLQEILGVEALFITADLFPVLSGLMTACCLNIVLLSAGD